MRDVAEVMREKERWLRQQAQDPEKAYRLFMTFSNLGAQEMLRKQVWAGLAVVEFLAILWLVLR